MIHGLATHGLAVAGAFHPAPGDGAPDGTGTLALIGADGARMWQVFTASPEYADGDDHPLDRWSERVIGAVAAAAGGEALFPFGGPPYHPFIRWAERAEGARVSPVAMQVAPRRGLWASYRGAIAHPDRLALPPSESADPCLGCPAPCLTACPVDAFAHGAYDVPRCVARVTSPEGARCRDGCVVRAACPAGASAAPPLEQRRFHMAAFLRAQAPHPGRP